MSDVFDRLKCCRAWVGLDGFVDKIICPVQERFGIGDRFVPYAKLSDFGEKIKQASGSNLNIELYTKAEKMGGNGPLLANGLANLGVSTTYVGTLGLPIHPVFRDFVKQTQATSIGNFGESQALEFQDGKLILGHTQTLDDITYERLTDYVPETTLLKTYNDADLISFQNWTMTMHLMDILQKILSHIWEKLDEHKQRICFFDLADPAKRSEEDVKTLLKLLPKFKSKAKVFLGVNRSEAFYVGKLLACPVAKNDSDFRDFLQKLRQVLDIDGVIMHCRDGAWASVDERTAFAPPQKAKQLTCLTGSGDHFNGGMLCGFLMHLSLEQCLTLGHITSVLYIETGRTPSLAEVRSFYQKVYPQEAS
ncbi:MAG: PfkB family carbohydrate kinase [bacterium]